MPSNCRSCRSRFAPTLTRSVKLRPPRPLFRRLEAYGNDRQQWRRTSAGTGFLPKLDVLVKA